MKQARDQRVGAPATGAALVATVALLAAGCSASASPPVSLPTPTAGDIICYLSLPDSTTSLSDAAASVATRGSSDYRHFRSLSAAARQFGATDAQISAVATSVQGLGLEFAADPTRLFGRVTGTTDQWQAALGTLLSEQAATASSPFTVYSLPHRTPAALQPSGTTLLLPDASVYDPAAAVSSPPAERPPTPSAPPAGPPAGTQPWPFNTGTPFTADCSAPLLQAGRVYTPQQIQNAYGLDTSHVATSERPVTTALDSGGGWLPNDLELAGECFGYSEADGTRRDEARTGVDPHQSLPDRPRPHTGIRT
jgi:hypothetical protein